VVLVGVLVVAMVLMVVVVINIDCGVGGEARNSYRFITHIYLYYTLLQKLCVLK